MSELWPYTNLITFDFEWPKQNLSQLIKTISYNGIHQNYRSPIPGPWQVNCFLNSPGNTGLLGPVNWAKDIASFRLNSAMAPVLPLLTLHTWSSQTPQVGTTKYPACCLQLWKLCLIQFPHFSTQTDLTSSQVPQPRELCCESLLFLVSFPV